MAPYLSLTDQRRLRITVPDPEQQQAIARVLGALDDKIELNRRMNRTLEELAGALFRAWFVDFEPVVAQAAGHAPFGLAPEVAALFPATFTDSELGPIPRGWRVGRLDEAAVLQRGFDLPAQSRIAGPFPVIAASGLNGMHSEFRVKGPGVTTGRSGVLGRAFYIPEDFWPLNTSLWVKEYPHSTPLHACHLLQSLDFETFNAGSAVPTLNRNHVHIIPVLLPARPVLEAFDRVARPLFGRVHANIRESRTLAALRDTLLPKLLSGELRVKDAEKLAAAT